ncbi:hypothetical protein C6P97_07800 [Burkholderia multivorans]|uniref:Uncharacterized protein n=1 Tax=Burkholderia multivorans TaxID=87883 RepID=A0AB37ASK1_9BURK|nr:hypothetical protein C6P99_19585 [Burkholderia multivorans]PRE52182.1 hypothetical protein C6P97_07800 [Burkholderia multivorans]
MYKIDFRSPDGEQRFFLGGVGKDDVDHVAHILAHHLSGGAEDQYPEGVAVSRIDDNGCDRHDLFVFVGKERFSGSAGQLALLRQRLLRQGILSCVVHGWRTYSTGNESFSELFKFAL